MAVLVTCFEVSAFQHVYTLNMLDDKFTSSNYDINETEFVEV
jgi:hypothetical protein